MALEGGWNSTCNRAIFVGSSTSTVASVNGKTSIVSTSRGDGASNSVQRDDFDWLVVTAWHSNSPLGAAPWPTLKQNNFRTGRVRLPTLPDPVAAGNFMKCPALDFLGRPAASEYVFY
jgi:hypothetical protein